MVLTLEPVGCQRSRRCGGENPVPHQGTIQPGLYSRVHARSPQSTKKSAFEPHRSFCLKMSLPILTTLSEITSLSVTVYPFLHQLSLSHLLPLLRREVNFTEWYLSTNPFISGLHFSLFFSVVVLVASETNRNYSQVDRLWSLLPPFYIAHFTTFAHMRGLETERLDTLAMFGCLWGVSCPPRETKDSK